jgi:hypothetical protein
MQPPWPSLNSNSTHSHAQLDMHHIVGRPCAHPLVGHRNKPWFLCLDDPGLWLLNTIRRLANNYRQLLAEQSGILHGCSGDRCGRSPYGRAKRVIVHTFPYWFFATQSRLSWRHSSTTHPYWRLRVKINIPIATIWMQGMTAIMIEDHCPVTWFSWLKTDMLQITKFRGARFS